MTCQEPNCCCQCKYHIEDFHHCITVKDTAGRCVCNDHKGWICNVIGKHYSGWPEHGGCECFVKIGGAK